MKILWEYALPTTEKSVEYEFESPILENGNHVCFVSSTAGTQRLHIIDQNTGEGRAQVLPRSVSVLPSKYFFLTHGDHAVLYTGDLYLLHDGVLTRTLSMTGLGEINAHLIRDGRLYIACNGRVGASLCCVDLDTLDVVWGLGISNSTNYRAGDPAFFGDLISCFGRDQLLFVQPEDGTIVGTLKLPRISKLFCPIRLDDDHLLIGYTNWSNAGILKYQISTKKILWRHKRKFEGPQLQCRIHYRDGQAFWVKNSTELICLNAENGEEVYRLPTTPWLYTDLCFHEDSILYGTSGADGYLNCLDRRSGTVRWAQFLKNGCAYYGLQDESVFVGDFSKTIREVSVTDGRIMDELHLDAEVVGQIALGSNCLYTVIWGNEEKDIRLVKISRNF